MYNPDRYNSSPLFSQGVMNDSGMSVRVLAEGLGVAERTISHWKEKGFPRYIEQYATEQFIKQATTF